jgi:hypothetical protein
MAFSTKVTFVPRDSGEKSVSFDMVDYGLDNIPYKHVRTKTKGIVQFESLIFREIGAYYFDYVATLNFEEYLEFHPIHHKTSYLPNTLNEFLEKEVEKIRYNWVIIEVYEWESGLS